MQLQVGRIYCGFKLVECKQVQEIHSQAYLFRHEKSGARLFFLENEDDNKVFSVSFRTPPEDSTGLPHILEHSVLCGSRKFPVKEPFVELVKGSLNTFLNAMTFSDKTMYPVASQNEKDFHNLMDVYLDAVFYPNIYKEPAIMMQEGWHYELKDREAPLTYKGVVFNEMKGAFSAPESVLERKIQESLFPDTPYSRESGGDPDVIPELTQKQFLDFHRKFYHPSNCYMFLYGKMDIVERLKFIDEEYVGRFDGIKIDSRLPLQKAFGRTQELMVEYPISRQEKPDGKTFISLNFVVGKATDPEAYLAFEILEHLLLETPAAPLKKALLDAGIGKDVFGIYNQSILQPTLTIAVRGADEEQKDQFVRIVYKTLQQLAENGIDKRIIESSLNITEFKLREANFGSYPKGLIYNIKCMDSWLYGADPAMHLAYEPALSAIKSSLTTRYFEHLIEQALLENTHRSVVIVKPMQGLGEQKQQLLRDKLAAYKAGLTAQEIDELVKQTHRLKERQTSPDSEEDLATIPLLALTDINPRCERLPREERREGDVTVLFHPLLTNKIAYIALYFDAGSVPQQLIPYVYLLSGLLGKVSTEEYHYTDLSNEINIHTGGITYNTLAYSDKDNDRRFYPKLCVKAKSLMGKLPDMFRLLAQILCRSRFDDSVRLQELIREIRAQTASRILEKGQQIAASRVLSYISPAAQYNENGNLTFYQFIEQLERTCSEDSEKIIRNLQTVAECVFQTTNLLVSYAAQESEYEQFARELPLLTNQLGRQHFPAVKYQFEFAPQNEGLMTSSKVQYVVKGANFRRDGFGYHGGLKVLETIFRYDYLWNRVRVQGGAYGGFVRFERNGNMVLGSYRDPNLTETLAVYDEAGDYLRAFHVSDREMTKYIIGTISSMDVPLTPSMKADRATEYYLQDISWAELDRERREVLSVGHKEIRRFAELVDRGMHQNYICVLGGEEKIRQNKDVFNTLVNVFE